MCALSETVWVNTPAGAAFLVVRLVFSKTGRARFISHLDLNRTMTRALRRAHLPIWYTEGYNKRPYLTFTAPLSLGFESAYECMDIRLTAEVPMEEIVARMNAVMPEGLRIGAAAPAVCKPGELAAADYSLHFGCSADTLTAFLAQPEIIAEKRTKKKEIKTVDLRPVLQGATVSPDKDGSALQITLPCSSEETVNPSLIAGQVSVFAGREVPCRICRLTLRNKQGERFV